MAVHDDGAGECRTENQRGSSESDQCPAGQEEARGSGYAEYDDAEREGIDPARLLEAYEVQAAASGTRTGVRVERSVSVEDCRTRERRAECDPGDCKPRA